MRRIFILLMCLPLGMLALSSCASEQSREYPAQASDWFEWPEEYDVNLEKKNIQDVIDQYIQHRYRDENLESALQDTCFKSVEEMLGKGPVMDKEDTAVLSTDYIVTGPYPLDRPFASAYLSRSAVPDPEKPMGSDDQIEINLDKINGVWKICE